jgi:hypothetical protein
MRYLLFFFLLAFSSCEEIIDVLKVDGPCTISLTDGSTISTQGGIEILQSTGTITYRDDQGKLWSVSSNQYESYSCGN